MLNSKSQSTRCLWLVFVICIIIVSVTVIYLDQNTSHISMVVITDGRFESKRSLLDLKDFNYVLESECCSRDIFTIIIVTSYAGDVETRSAARRAYPSSLLANLFVKRVFLLALIDPNKKPNLITQEAINDEHDKFGDIIQGNFIEDYRNLTYKHIMGLRWASQCCSSTKFVIKMDHDIVYDLFSILKMLRKLPPRDLILAGNVLTNMKPIRDPTNKWYVKQEEYSLDNYPEFLSGWLYISNSKTAQLLNEASDYVPYFWIDDTYVTGLLASKLGLTLVKLNRYFTTQAQQIRCCIKFKNYSCNYWVGPNDGDPRLIVEFENHVENCNNKHCKAFNGSLCYLNEME